MSGMALATTRLSCPTITRTADLDRGLLVAAGLEHERAVMLEPTEDGLTVRKLTAAEKVAELDRSGEPAFLGSEEELGAFLDAIRAADDPA
jgi:hypothetical protein